MAAGRVGRVEREGNIEVRMCTTVVILEPCQSFRGYDAFLHPSRHGIASEANRLFIYSPGEGDPMSEFHYSIAMA